MNSNPFDIRTAKRVRLLLPWETGYAGMVLSKPSDTVQRLSNRMLNTVWDHAFVRAALKDQPSSGSNEEVELDETMPGLGQAAYLSVGRVKPSVPWASKVEDSRKVAMERWRMIINENPSGSTVGLQLLEAGKFDSAQERAENILQDVFAGKATRTLEMRAGSLLLFSSWRRSLPLFKGILPFLEDDCYEYLSSLRVGKAPATRAKRFRESIGFAFGLIGARGSEEVLQSRRCQGAALRSFATKGNYVQRDPFLAAQIDALERGVFEMPDEHDRIMCGNTLCLVHVRGRFSDVLYCQSEPFIDNSKAGVPFFEVPVLDTKVSRRDKRRRCLPLVGLALGLRGVPWAAEWLRLRKAHGLDATQGPLMVAITAGGNWTSSRLRSQEAVVWIRILLRKLENPIIDGQVFGTHSCKCTLLSWMAKAGCSLEHRNILGFHAAGAAESSLLYARAAYAGPLRVLDQLLAHIRMGRFLPDDTRSGNWVLEPVGGSSGKQQPGDPGSESKSCSEQEPIPGIDFDADSQVDLISEAGSVTGDGSDLVEFECDEEILSLIHI